MFETKDAILLVPLRLCNLFIAVFPRLIIFGSLKNDKFLLKETFCIEIGNFQAFYFSILKILSVFQLDSFEENVRQEELCSFDCFMYHWEMKDTEAVKLVSKTGNEIVHCIQLHYSQFNELIFLFSECILTSLCLRRKELEFCLKISNLNIKEIIELKDPAKLEVYAQESFYNEKFFQLKIIFYYHVDIIIILNKFRNICNVELLPNKIDNLFNDV